MILDQELNETKTYLVTVGELYLDDRTLEDYWKLFRKNTVSYEEYEYVKDEAYYQGYDKGKDDGYNEGRAEAAYEADDANGS